LRSFLPERFRVGYAFGGGWVEFTRHALSRNGNANYTEEAIRQPVRFFLPEAAKALIRQL